MLSNTSLLDALSTVSFSLAAYLSLVGTIAAIYGWTLTRRGISCVRFFEANVSTTLYAAAIIFKPWRAIPLVAYWYRKTLLHDSTEVPDPNALRMNRRRLVLLWVGCIGLAAAIATAAVRDRCDDPSVRAALGRALARVTAADERIEVRGLSSMRTNVLSQTQRCVVELRIGKSGELAPSARKLGYDVFQHDGQWFVRTSSFD